ncbi:hypothetical protein A9Q99_27810 [Gammaproteobacteria bacterium 45_16_T64]|nr:hypothetical protein A9Q99_27810 [Gammaproteobacteria bacterium 45_16_T64]
MAHQITESALELVRKTTKEAAAQSILQIGTGSYESSKVLVDALNNLEEPQFTLVVSDNDSAVLEQLNNDGLDEWADIVPQSADQVLPDFYFQEHRFDLAIINPGYTYDETLVCFYYINKMLSKGNKIIVSQATDDKMHALCRHILEAGDFVVSAASESPKQVSKLEGLVRAQYNKLPQWIHRQAEMVINPALLENASSLGLDGDVIVFEKITEVEEKLEDEVDVDAMIEAMI